MEEDFEGDSEGDLEGDSFGDSEEDSEGDLEEDLMGNLENDSTEDRGGKMKGFSLLGICLILSMCSFASVTS